MHGRVLLCPESVSRRPCHSLHVPLQRSLVAPSASVTLTFRMGGLL